MGVLKYFEVNVDVWVGWLWWVGGLCWGDYFLLLELVVDGWDWLQMCWL